ncbi:MAG: T9SS C-terminal target domain-containing protein [Cytophagales bacterium]|nr:MAG: T9SS C-terminal target domain-containing protein [Cytophagales bacterium]
MKKIILSIGFLLSVFFASAWNPMKVGQKFPFNRLMLDSDGELTSLDDLLAEGRPVMMATNTTDCPNCHEPNLNLSSWMRNNPNDRVKMTVIYIVHEFRQSAKMGYSNAAKNGQDKGYVGDWKNIYTGYENATGFAYNSTGDQWFFPDEQGSTPYWWVLGLGRTFMTRGGGGESWEKCRNEILKMYTDGKLTAYSSQAKKPTMTIVINGDEATVTLVNNESGSVLHYTVDGTIPNDDSPVYSGPFKVKSSRLVRAQSRKTNAYPSKVVVKPVIINSSSFVNIAPQGKAYSWNNDYLTAGNSNQNRVALTGLNDNNTSTDVRLSQVAKTSYVDGDNAFKYASWQGGGVVWDNTVQNVTHFEYFQGKLDYSWWGANGTYIWDIKLQLTFDGTTWQDAEKYGYFNEFPFGKFYSEGKAGGSGAFDYPASQKVPSPYAPVTFYLDKPTALRGFRIIGGFNVNSGYESGDQIRVRELKAFQNNTITSLEENNLSSEINIFPNPTNSNLTIQYPLGALKNNLLQITDMKGKVVKTQATNGSEVSTEINVSELPSGVYILSAPGNKNLNKTFIKE